MKRTAFIIISLLIGLLSYAQQNPVFFIDDFKNVFLTDVDYQVNSTAITNEFFNNYYKSNFLTDDVKQRSIDKLKDNNLLGASFNYRIFYAHQLDTSKGKSCTEFFLSMENHNLIESEFKRDFFKLIFNGNAQFAGKTVDLSDMSLNYLAYQQFKIGLFRNIHKNGNKHLLGAALAFNKGQNNISIDINNAAFFTEVNGEYVDFNLSTDIKHSDTSVMNLGAFNGYGGCMDIFYAFTDKKGNTLQFEINNLGFIRWNKHSCSFSKDTLYHFDGWEVNDIFNINGETFKYPTSDSLIDEFTKNSTKKGYTSLTPSLIQVSYKLICIKNKLSLTGGINQLLFTAYKPFIFFKPTYSFNTKTNLSPILSYGGYGKLNIGVEASINIAKRITINTGTSFLNGYFSPKTNTGQGAFASIFVML